MARLELTDEEADTLRDTLDMDIEYWNDELDRICTQPFDTWEELLRESAIPAQMITILMKLRKQLQ